MTAAVVSNSSPLIAFEQINQLELLHKLFSRVLVPPAVAAEIRPTVPLLAWIEQRPLSQPVSNRILSASLGPGESEAIALAVELDASGLILDDRAARRLADSMGLPIIGTVGILLAAKRRGLLHRIGPSLQALVDAGFHVAPELIARVLRDAGEGP